MKSFGTCAPLLTVAAIGAGLATTAMAEAMPSRGQLLFVPIYSSLAYGERNQTLNLSSTLTIRNTDRQNPIELRRVDYYGAAGTLLRAYLPKPQSIAPMASVEYIVSGADRSGGTAASFLVEWDSAAPRSAPVVEAVMISTASMHGISFKSEARVLEERH